jgi:uncharacterized RDD family membrane protein YckC
LLWNVACDREMKTRFESDSESVAHQSRDTTSVDPEPYDASEQQFAASLERPVPAKFVVNESVLAGPDDLRQRVKAVDRVEDPEPHHRVEESPAETSDVWRQEVQARISHYRRRRRTQPPRYPSLQLKFENTEVTSNENNAARAVPDGNALAIGHPQQDATTDPSAFLAVAPGQSAPRENVGRLIEFPRIAAPPPQRDELAEPIFDRPRIVEVPDVLPPPPALGGILIEPTEEEIKEKRQEFDLPLRTASMARRLVALFIDGLIVTLSFALFAYTFLKINPHLPTLRQILSISAGLIACFWAGYQYALLVYTGTTPGLRLAKLNLSRFDGRPVPQRLRQWRVLASVLSGLSLALGYAWCFFDEDRLCWHDRITHTYLAPRNSK